MDEDEKDIMEEDGGGSGEPPAPRGKGPCPPLPTPVGPQDEVWRGRGAQNGQREKDGRKEGFEGQKDESGPGDQPEGGRPAADLPEGMEPDRGGEPGSMPEGGDPRPYREGAYEQSRRGEQGGGRGREGGGRDRGRRDGRDRGRREGDRRERQPQGRPPDVDRQLVLPGDMLGTHVKGGNGTFREGESVYAACLGIRSTRDGFVSVIPLSGKYIPRRGDFVIGKVVEMTPSAWVLDLNSPYVAPLPGSETPWDAQFGEAHKYMSMGDSVLVEIRDINEIGRVSVTMMGPNLHKLVGGQTIDVDATKVPRLIGRGGSMIGLLKRLTRCHIIVGQNGRVWLDGTVEDVTIALAAIKKIEEDAHKLGLTDAVAAYIEAMRRELDAKRARKEAGDDAREKTAVLQDRAQKLEVQEEE